MADHRHKRDADARRRPRAVLVAAPIALLATGTAVTLGVLASDPATGDLLASRDAAGLGHVRPGSRDVVSRSESRLDLREVREDSRQLQRAYDRSTKRLATLRAVRGADTRLWTTTLLNLWSDPSEQAEKLGLLEAGKHVLVTGRKGSGRVEVVVDGESRWVTAGYLSDDKPEPEPEPETGTSAAGSAAGLSTAPCPDSSVESGLTSSAVRVYRSVCHAFPQITSYGGWDAHGEHASGRAIDIMTSDKALGDQIAAFLQSHASELGLYDIIWWDQIWTPERASEGWRYYGDHGSATANHMDHVHVSTNG